MAEQLFNFGTNGGAGMGGASSNQFFPVLPPSGTFNMPNRTAMPGSGGAGAGPAPGNAGMPPGGFIGKSPFSPLQASGGSAMTTVPLPTPPGVAVPPAGPAGSAPTSTVWGGLAPWGSGFKGQGPLDPSLTNAFEQYLQSQIGQGLTPFNLPTQLPWGGTTFPGQMNAPLDPVMKELLSGFTGGGFQGMPGMGTLQNVAQNGISALPTWNPMVEAMQRQIGQGAANLKEQFNVGSGVVGTPYGTAATDYQTQSNLDLNSLLANMQFQGDQMQLGAADTLAGIGTRFGTELQQEGQQNIQNMYNEFLRTQPQYNPLLPYEMGLGTTFQPVIQKGSQGGGVAGGILGGIGTFLGSLFGAGGGGN